MKFSHYVLAAAMVFASAAFGQEYPVRNIRLIVPFSPGGSTDALARVVAQKLTEQWGQSVIVEHRVGGGGHIGAELVVKAPPDGYTLLMGGVPHAISMSLYKKLAYDMARDLTAIANVAQFPSLIVVHPSLPVKNVKELLALAKSRPGQINYGSAGSGSPNHLSIELMNTMGNVKLVHIPYKGGGQVVIDLIAGQIQMASMGFPPAIPQVKAGRLRAIAVTSLQRSPLFPEIPTVSESGLPGFEVNSWYGVFGPAATPKAVVSRLNGAVAAMLGSPDTRERLAPLGAEPAPMEPDAYARYVRNEIAKWAKVVQASGARVD